MIENLKYLGYYKMQNVDCKGDMEEVYSITLEKEKSQMQKIGRVV